MQNEIFNKFRKRLVLEGILKAFLLGLAVCGGVEFIVAFITWFVPSFKGGLWLSIGLGLGVGAIVGVLVYFLKYRPTTEDVARRLDRMGMQERMITMLELNGDESYMATAQRENAVGVASTVSSKGLKIGASVVSIVLACVFGIAVGPAMTTVTALSAQGIIDKGGDFIDSITETDVFYEVEYAIGNGSGDGEILGDIVQVVKAGESTLQVTADPDDESVFYEWQDEFGNSLGKNPVRIDTNINNNLVIYAIFAQSDESDDGDEEGDDEGDKNAPSNPGDPNQNGGGGAGGLEDNGSNSVIDGETPYSAVFDEYYRLAMQYLADNGTIPEYLRKIIETYFGVLA
ncbi:MAG: DUF4175 domain-containing protein [Clostridiales bacterium]|nr:DUF4175 domain-containing protein [Clostridiales bacterium]